MSENVEVYPGSVFKLDFYFPATSGQKLEYVNFVFVITTSFLHLQLRFWQLQLRFRQLRFLQLQLRFLAIATSLLAIRTIEEFCWTESPNGEKMVPMSPTLYDLQFYCVRLFLPREQPWSY
jgi:hypothetical protein